jgi:hypothetical protein
MTRIRHVLGGALAVFILMPACVEAVTIRADRQDSQYIGLAASNPAYASVGRFTGTASESGGTFQFIASGTLIAPDWVLTAGHVVDHTTALSFSIGGKNYTSHQWIANPNWTGDLMAGYDIGLVHLDSPVAGVTPATRYTGASETAKVGTAVGYGMTGTGSGGAVKLDNNKRAAQNVIDQIRPGSPGLFLSDFDSPRFSNWFNSMGSSRPLNLEGLIAPGDSGGGVFIDTPQGTQLAGVNSFVGSWDSSPNSSYGDMSGHTRVSYFNAWINDVMSRTPAYQPTVAMGPYGAQAVSLPVPEPGTLGLLGMAAALLLAAWRLRRR